jgi:carboxypeptidase C (cathepsin A)
MKGYWKLISFGLIAAVTMSPATAQGPQTPAHPPAGASGEHSRPVADLVHERMRQEAADAWTTPSATETATSTAHSINVGGRTLNYHATAGTLVIRDNDGKPVASMFYTAYTLDGANPSLRPITFFYNGGPGSSSIWLHMGSLAPMRVQTGNPEAIQPAPFHFGPNPDTLLDRSDLIFLDAIGTGYSAPIGDATGAQFWGVDQDADAFARGIMRWTERNNRWMSPKFLFGESYGTTRSAAVAWQLQDRGLALNGVILLSSILNYGIEQEGYDQQYISYLPSYAAAAWYHNRIADRPSELAPFLAQVRAFAAGPYAAALQKGDAITPEETDAIARQLSAYTGLSVEFIKRANLRIDLDRFRKELLRDQRLVVGRYDARYTGVDPDANADSPDFDPSDTAISGAFIAAFQDYLARDLNYHSDIPYRVAAYGTQGFQWDWHHRLPNRRWPQTTPDVAPDLAMAMRTNPYLHVLSLNGWYDMATPFFATEYDLSHMMIGADQQRNITFHYYPSGHMVYLNPAALHQLHADLETFYDSAVNAAASGRPNG